MGHALANFLLSGAALFVALLVVLVIGAASSSSKANSQQLNERIQTAVDIAKRKGWVSRYRLVKQIQASKLEAVMVLRKHRKIRAAGAGIG
jgi:hypothetical protein